MLSPASAALIVIDIQGSLFQAMLDKENLLAQAIKVIKGANAFNLPIIVTEQTPAKLGQTVHPITQELNGSEIISKETFSCWGNDQFREKLETVSRRNVIVMGIESHVCVYQTAIDLMENGYNVLVVADAVSSRTKENSAIGIEAMKRVGVHITSAEMILFELLRSAGDTKFKDIYKIVK
jgi:nicotinamidase-related amidase